MPEILREEKDFLIINKPAGLVVHSDGRTKDPTLCDWTVEKFPEIAKVGEPFIIKDQKTGTEIKIDRPGIVHRLDRDTSGVILVARNQEFFEYIKKQFQQRLIEKTYHAFVYGNIKEDSLIIDEPIGRSKKDFRQKFAGTKVRGEAREALTEIKVLKRSTNKDVTFVEASPKTGRTHQIRVHLRHIYHPIVCDSLYAPNREALLGFNRTALHARTLKFADLSGRDVSVTAPYPADFEAAISLIK